MVPRFSALLLFTVALGLVSLICLVRTTISLWPVHPLVERPGFGAAMEHLVERARPDTFVLVWPPHQAGALEHLPPSLSAADALPQERPNDRHYLDIMVIGPDGFAPPPGLEEALQGGRFEREEIEIASFSYPAEDRVVFDLRDELEDVEVQLTGPAHNVTCDAERRGGGWQCPSRPSWNHVGPTVLQVEGRPWPCVWVHPVQRHDMVLDLGELRLWDRIELLAALSDTAASRRGGAPVKLRLEIEGLGDVELSRSNDRGIAKRVISTARGRRARVRLFVSTRQDAQRHLGLNLRVIEEHSR